MTEETPTAGTTISPPVRDANGLAIAGLVCGLAGMLFFDILFVPGVLAIVFGGIGWSRANRGAQHLGMAMAGVILGVVDVVVFGVLMSAAASHAGSPTWHVF